MVPSMRGLRIERRAGAVDELEVRSVFNDEVVPYWLAVMGAECCRARDQPPTPEAVEGLLRETLGRALRRIPGFKGEQTRADQIAGAILAPDALVCPRCGAGYLVPGTRPADDFGVCEACYRRAQAVASGQYADELRAAREYAAARKHKSREKKAAGQTKKAKTGEKW